MISIATVFSLLMFTILLVMIVNVATHLDDKIKMQNAADAAAYSGGVVLARGMNAVAFTNHLLTDVFAMTAFLREARDRNAEELTPEILDEWERTGRKFSRARFEKFQKLGAAILDKVPKERRLVEGFGNLSQAASAFTLPVFEMILREQRIPNFQRTVLRTIPELARQATAEIAYRHGLKPRELEQLEQTSPTAENERTQAGLLWRMNGMTIGDGDEEDPLTRTLPVVDPDPAETDFEALPNAELYLSTALTQRRELAKYYLERWTREKLQLFDRDAEMSQFSNFWRIFTCAHLERLLDEEYPVSNLPMIIRQPEAVPDLVEMQATGQYPVINRYLERNFNFLGVVYRKHLKETGPGVFRNPLARETDAMTFAQISLFLPRARYVLANRKRSPPTVNAGGTFGFDSEVGLPPAPVDDPAPQDERWVRENWPRHWDLLNQNWTVKLVPATAEAVPEILQSHPGQALPSFRPPNLGGMSIRELKKINTH